MQKDTSKIVEELELSPDFHTFYAENQDTMVTESLSDMLNALLKSKGLSKSVVIRHTDFSDIYAYQIFSGLRMPDRKKLLNLALAMHLTAAEAQSLLKCAGYPPLYVKRPFDCIVLYGFQKQLSAWEVNEMLLEYEQETLV